VEVTITQGEDAAPEYVNRIATHRLELPPERPANCPIKVTYSYDVNQRMHCRFEDLESDRVLEVELCLDKDGNVMKSQTGQTSDHLEAFKVE
jgi:hypothetical protein